MRRRTAAIGLCLALLGASGASAQPSQGEGVWVPTLHVSPQGKVELELFRDGTAFAHNTGDASFWYSPNGGRVWTPRPPLPANGATPQMDFSSPERGYAMSNGQLFESTDLGLTWKPVSAPSFDVTWEEGLSVLSDLEAVKGSRKLVILGHKVPKVDECPTLGEETAVFYGTPGNWKSTKIPFPSVTWEVEFLNERVGLLSLVETKLSRTTSCGFQATGYRYSVQKTTDGGRTFEEIYSVLQEEDGVLSVAIPTPRKIFLGMDSGRVLRSTDGGRTFEEAIDLVAETGRPGLWVDQITFANPLVGYVGSNAMGTWRTFDGGRTWVHELSHQNAPGLNIGDLVAVGPNDALLGGPWAIARREMTP
ncbi:MAG TPA: hypothetical protein VHN37_04510 [Actinomycetota bacterium]|nr:hypothetical protein [Actinomycetota bacterium]